MVETGQCLKVTTKTFEDVFGTCYYEVIATDLPSPEKGRDGNDGVRCKMLGGSGLAARKDFEVQDSQMKIANEIAAGTTTVLTKEQALKMMAGSKDLPQSAPGDGVGHSGTGCMEIPS